MTSRVRSRRPSRLVAARCALTAALAAVLVPLAAASPGNARAAGGALPAVAPVAAVPPAGAAPAAKARSSWETERTEEFSGSDLPDGCGAYSGKYTAGKSAWSSRAVDVSDGLLQLSLEKRRTSGQPYTSGGVGCWGWAQKYGRFEVKAKVPAGQGIDSYLTLWPVKGGAGGWSGIELLAPGPETAYVTNGYGTKSEGSRVTGSYSGRFRTYVIEWAPKHVRMTVDGDEIFYSTRSFTGQRWLGLVVSNGDALTGVPDAGTKLPATFQIDRVRISSYTGVPPKAREGSLAPSRSRLAGVPTTVPTAVPTTAAAKAPTATPPTSPPALAAARTAQAGPVLVGGIWPWLLGGSLIAVFAVASLNYPHHRRARRSTPRQ